jgi:hypothetical protein
MNSLKIILLLIIILIICLVILFFINKQNKNHIQIFDKFTDLDNASPLYQNCIGTNNNCPLNKQKLVREETPDGYKIGDDSYTCLCKCSRKCNTNTTPTPNSSNNSSNDSPNSTNRSNLSLGYRINTYPWFVKTR